MARATHRVALGIALGCFALVLGGPGAVGLPAGLQAGDGPLYISEFLASNRGVARDQDGDSSDYLEIFNAGLAAVNVGGYYLTDNAIEPTKWRLPARTIAPGGFLLVWASGKDRAPASGELHASFKLETTPGYLGLIEPDGTTEAHAYAPYPPQVTDFSYGLAQNATRVALVVEGAAARALVPSNGTLGSSWISTTFNDGSWDSGPTGVGYDRNAEYRPFIGLDVRAAMENTRTTCYIRIPFNVADASAISALSLRVRYDDGFAAYLNGTFIGSANAPAGLDWDSEASTLHDDSLAVEFEDFPVSANGVAALRSGTNVLAIHGLNDNLGSSDFLISPELDGFNSGELDAGTILYFPTPSPGSGNLPGVPGVAFAPTVVPTSRVFTSTLQVQMATQEGTGVVRYTTDGSVPTATSTAYSSAITISGSTQFRARSFQPDGSVSPVTSRNYVRLATDVQDFSSDLPVFVIENFGAGSVPANGFQPCFIALYEPQAGVTRLSGAPSIQARGGIRIRGSSTQGRPKKAYRFEFRDEADSDLDLAPLGLPEESDWILYGAYNFDLAHIRNAFIYEMSNQVGRYAVRTRFCEVFVNEGGGALADSDYVGLYTFMENIKRGPDRVDVERPSPSATAEPEIAGGYMWKIDRADPGDSGFNAASRSIRWVEPKEDEVSPAQASWVVDYFNDFYSALQGPSFRDPVNGYRRYIVPESWADHSILNVLPKNVDALRLSTYFFKTRAGKIEFGPIWDFDRSMNSTDGRDDSPTTWNGTGDGTDYFNYPWWDRLFQDNDFWQLWRDRWATHRQGPLSDSNMRSVIDGMAAEIESAIPRESARWNQTSVAGWRSQINLLRNWLTQRAAWIDGQFAPLPVFSRVGGPISSGETITVTTSNGVVYYTLDGQDPRVAGGGILPAARVASGPITLLENAKVFARTRFSVNDWSAPRFETYWTELPPVVITEVHYHPADPSPDSPFSDDDFEFVEVMNIGPDPIDLAGFTIAGGIDFTFGSVVVLPGEHAVVVEDLEAFASRYGDLGITIAGEYAGRLDNDGDTLRLLGPLDEPLLDFAYDDAWYPSTDGQGFSLNIRDPDALRLTWGDAESWAASSVAGGTPGYGDDSFPPLGGLVLPADANRDGALDVSDGFALALQLFVGNALPCDGALDSPGNLAVLDGNGDARVDISDVLYVLGYLFQGGPAPVAGRDCVRVEGCTNACSF